ncbi:hypothetical protein JK628_01460 [Shewanella sp. KX20019]|uniref:hypothetical protein n=1 Tax=Shewanella sp. KX20019 TaxID=2803864 RepID=UPI001926E344|nr:hypothetical protein [Shewanella sp. KX20019]QQX80578.1 hypothetical protein JK628_01460 [Shewanella sp. KX20019]
MSLFKGQLGIHASHSVFKGLSRIYTGFEKRNSSAFEFSIYGHKPAIKRNDQAE